MTEDLRSLTLEQKIGQLFFIGVPGPESDDATRDLLAEVVPGGVCLFARNVRDGEQTRRLLDDIRSCLPVEPLLSIDQEGGLVDRLRRVITPMPSASAIKTADNARELAEIIAAALRTLGFNMNFAPVVDVIGGDRGDYSNGLATRTFGSSAAETTELAGTFLITLQQNGIIGCVKHFPGLGASRVDSHEELPIVDVDEDELRSTDLFPYRELFARGDVHATMVAHAAYPRLNLQEMGQNGKLLPSSLSYNVVTSLLRGDLSFDGLVVTDDLEMGAIKNNYGIGEACKMAVLAGADMLAICADPAAIREGRAAVLETVKHGDIAEERIDESLERISKLRSMIAAPIAFDAVELASLSSRVEHLAQNS